MSDVLSQVSEDLANVVAGSERHVVRVEGRRRLPASGVVWNDEGIIVTAHHVLERDEEIAIGVPSGDVVEAELVGRDPTTDLAVLRAATADLSTPQWSDAERLQVGQLVLAVGRPRRSLQATLGIVSALGDAWRTPVGGSVDHYLQTDVVMYPGFSGGPLVGAEAHFLGINTSGLLRGVSLTLPTPTVRRVVETLLTHGKVRRGYLGVAVQPVRLPNKQAQAVGQETGLLVASLEADAPAERAGIHLGDTLLAFNDQSLRQMDDLMGSLTADVVGQQVNLRVLRGGEVTEVSVVIGERGAE